MQRNAAPRSQGPARSFDLGQLPDRAQALIFRLVSTPKRPVCALLARVSKSWKAAAARTLQAGTNIELDLTAHPDSSTEQKSHEAARLTSLAVWMRRYGHTARRLVVRANDACSETGNMVAWRSEGVREVVKAVAEAGQQQAGGLPLKVLRLPAIGGTDPETLSSCLSMCPHLEQLQLDYCYGDETIHPLSYFDPPLTAALQGLQHLTQLRLGFVMTHYMWELGDPSQANMSNIKDLGSADVPKPEEPVNPVNVSNAGQLGRLNMEHVEERGWVNMYANGELRQVSMVNMAALGQHRVGNVRELGQVNRPNLSAGVSLAEDPKLGETLAEASDAYGSYHREAWDPNFFGSYSTPDPFPLDVTVSLNSFFARLPSILTFLDLSIQHTPDQRRTFILHTRSLEHLVALVSLQLPPHLHVVRDGDPWAPVLPSLKSLEFVNALTKQGRGLLPLPGLQALKAGWADAHSLSMLAYMPALRGLSCHVVLCGDGCDAAAALAQLTQLSHLVTPVVGGKGVLPAAVVQWGAALSCLTALRSLTLQVEVLEHVDIGALPALSRVVVDVGRYLYAWNPVMTRTEQLLLRLAAGRGRVAQVVLQGATAHRRQDYGRAVLHALGPVALSFAA